MTIDHTPEELKAARQWVCWRVEKRAEKPTKIPVNPHTGRRADTSDPETWGSFDEALAYAERTGAKRLGFVFSADDPYCGIDLDADKDDEGHVTEPIIDSETGEVKPWALDIVRRLDSYTEISPSGTGLHVIVKGALPPGRRKKGPIEMYSEGRFFTMTGDHLEGTPAEIAEKNGTLETIHAHFFGEREESPKENGAPVGGGFSGDDAKLVEQAKRATNGAKFTRLWEGDASGYPSHSEADLALCSSLAFWAGDDPDRIDRLFRESGLYREKWKRPDYRQRTIRAAIERRSEFYTDSSFAGATRRNGDGPPPTSEATKQTHHAPSYNLTDLGNAERLAARHGHDLRYCYPWAKWLVWDGRRWRVDDCGEVEARAKETVRSIYKEAAEETDTAKRKALADHARRSEAEGKVKAMVALARSEPGIPVSPDALDSEPWLLNVANGTLDLRNGELHPHDRADLITKLAPVAYDPDAQAPTWEAFLVRILPDESVRNFVQRAVGYSLTADTRERVLLILHGSGRNGKSTFLEAVRDMLGHEEGYAMKTPAETLMAKPAGGIPNDIARLKGARFVSAAETEANRRLAEALVKEITGNDTVSARFMRGEWFDFKPSHKTWLATNHKPVIAGTDPAIWDRIRLVPFEVRIPDDEQDRALPEKLRDELPGILAWAVRGCLDWQRGGLGEPHKVRAATESYRAEMDVLAAFIDECCVVHPGSWVRFADIYKAYTDWCEESGEKPETKRAFGDLLTERGYTPDKGGKNVSIRRGIALRSDGTPPDNDNPQTGWVTQDSPRSGHRGGGDAPETPSESNRVTQDNPLNNPKNSCKTQENDEGVTQGYSKTPLNTSNYLTKGLTGNQGNQSNLSNPTGSEGQQREIQKLVKQGWSEYAARVQVLAPDHPLACECEVCG